jgi:glutamyl-Q tRNA(Asp) synthetase
LHAGSLVAALASWLDARAHAGQWLVRIDDVDTARTVPGATARILQQLTDCALIADAPAVSQADRTEHYQQALEHLMACNLAYPCGCSRKDITAALQQRGLTRSRHSELVYPGTCATGKAAKDRVSDAPIAWRFHTPIYKRKRALGPVNSAQDAIETVAPTATSWNDRRLGWQQQVVHRAVGDFVLKRADGCFTYQLAVVVDDAAQGISHIVRGEDLADNTARQILLQRALGLPTPLYLHTPLVRGSNGEKLSKQNDAPAIDTSSSSASLAALTRAAQVLGLPASGQVTPETALCFWIQAWRSKAARLP